MTSHTFGHFLTPLVTLLCPKPYFLVIKTLSKLSFFQVKGRKKSRQVALQYASSRKALEEEVSSSHSSIWSQIDHLKSDLTNDHLRKMLQMMFHEQNRTEELLTNRYHHFHQ